MRSFKQELVALFGRPVAENPTQAMIEAAFRRAALDWRYLTIEVAPEDLEAAVLGARAMGFRGFHCTIPHKVEVVPLLDRLGDSAALIGAVNCVVADGEELVGENTDGRGFVEALRRRLDPAGTRVAILGAGGAARAIAVELGLAGARELTIVNRGERRGHDLVDLLQGLSTDLAWGLRVQFLSWEGEFHVPPCDALVNATSIGLYPAVGERVPVHGESLAPGTLVADVIPNPPSTRFLEEARARGCETLDGLEMLVEQGALSVRYWARVEVDRAVLRAALADVFALPPVEAGDR